MLFFNNRFNNSDSLTELFLSFTSSLCLRCHHIVTYIETKLGFTKMKMILNKLIKYRKKTEEEYDKIKLFCQKIYDEKMLDIYEKITCVF